MSNIELEVFQLFAMQGQTEGQHLACQTNNEP